MPGRTDLANKWARQLDKQIKEDLIVMCKYLKKTKDENGYCSLNEITGCGPRQVIRFLKCRIYLIDRYKKESRNF